MVAGVVQLKWVSEAVTELFGHNIQLSGMEAVKFHQLLFPGDRFLMEILHKRGKWVYHISSGDRKIASGRMLESLRD